MSNHLFVGDNGDLYDTRNANWSALPPLRKAFKTHSTHISNIAQVKSCLRAGQYAWPGGYDLMFATTTGDSLCFKCVKEEFHQVIWEFDSGTNSGWRICDLFMPHEENHICCDQCGEESK